MSTLGLYHDDPLRLRSGILIINHYTTKELSSWYHLSNGTISRPISYIAKIKHERLQTGTIRGRYFVHQQTCDDSGTVPCVNTALVPNSRRREPDIINRK